MYEVHIFLLILTIMFGVLVYFEIRKYEFISSIFSSVWGAEFSGYGYCCIQVYIFC